MLARKNPESQLDARRLSDYENGDIHRFSVPRSRDGKSVNVPIFELARRMKRPPPDGSSIPAAVTAVVARDDLRPARR